MRNGSRDFTVFGVIDNLLDKDPPAGSFILLSGLGTSPSSSFNPYDTIGRTFKLGVRFNY